MSEYRESYDILNDLADENERLRNALREIAGCWGALDADHKVRECVLSIVNHALGEKP
jgi:hypothetical protein